MRYDEIDDLKRRVTALEALCPVLVAYAVTANPKDATPGNRPAGHLREIVSYNNKLYFCTNASTPTWEEITSS